MGMAFATSTPLRLLHKPQPTLTVLTSAPKMTMALETVDKYYPTYSRSRAPFISISSDPLSVYLEMKPVESFVNTDNQAEQGDTLFDYDDRDFKPRKGTTVGSAWPSGDGRRVEMIGTEGSFTQPDLRTYGPFPDFYKRSCEL